jgi:hypothetical protein
VCSSDAASATESDRLSPVGKSQPKNPTSSNIEMKTHLDLRPTRNITNRSAVLNAINKSEPMVHINACFKLANPGTKYGKQVVWSSQNTTSSSAKR